MYQNMQNYRNGVVWLLVTFHKTVLSKIVKNIKKFRQEWMEYHRKTLQKLIKPTRLWNCTASTYFQLQTSFKLWTNQKTWNCKSGICMFLLSFTVSRYYNIIFRPFLFLFRVYNGCVLRNLQEARVGDVITRVEEQWNVN